MDTVRTPGHLQIISDEFINRTVYPGDPLAARTVPSRHGVGTPRTCRVLDSQFSLSRV